MNLGEIERVGREKRTFDSESAVVGCLCTPERFQSDDESTGSRILKT